MRMTGDRQYGFPWWLKITAFVLVLATIAAFFVLRQRHETEKRAELKREAEACEQEIAPLMQERDELSQRIKQIDIQLKGKDLNLASVIVLFVRPYKEVIDNALPKMQAHDFPCVVCCSPGFFPGDPDCITVEQAQELVSLGWEFGLSLTAEDDVVELCDKMVKLGLPSPTMAYYPKGKDFDPNDSATEEALHLYGITTVVLPYESLPEDSEAHEMNYIEAYAIRSPYRRWALASAVETSNMLTFTVGIENAERYAQNYFSTFVSTCLDYVQKNCLSVTTTDQAVARRAEYTMTREERQASLTAERDECTRKMEELEEEMVRVYHQYIHD